MKLRCETASKILLPTLRALIAKELIEKYNFTQQDVASKLDLTQSAISQYLRNLRGSKIKVLENKEIEIFANKIASGELNSSNISDSLCVLCKNIRKKGRFQIKK